MDEVKSLRVLRPYFILEGHRLKFIVKTRELMSYPYQPEKYFARVITQRKGII